MQHSPCFLIIGLLLAIITVQVCCESSSSSSYYSNDPPNTSSFQPFRRTTLLQEQSSSSSSGNNFLSTPNYKPQLSLSKAKIDIPDLDCILENEDDNNQFWKTPIDYLEEEKVTDKEIIRKTRQQQMIMNLPQLY